jgi:menaquinone-dependent protoporphyrinogen oxidase
MKVLVAAASKHGATQQIAEAIGEELTARELHVTVAHVEDLTSITGYDAVIMGSAIYFGKWMKPAKQFVTRHAAELATRPVWLYSSGPIPRPEAKADYSYDRREGDEIANAIRAREHRLFLGRLDRKRLSLVERGPVRMAKLPDGDFRPWEEIKIWAAGIADALQSATAR